MATEIRIANLDAFLQSVRIAKAQVGDLTVPMTDIARDWMRTNQIYFNQSPGAFADLSNGEGGSHVKGFGVGKTGEKGGNVGGYKKEKLKRYGFVYPMLVASGALRSSLTQMGDSNSLFEIFNKSTLALGTKVVGKGGANYPMFLNYGTKKMPARHFMEIPKLSVARWMGILKKFVFTAWGPPGKPAVAQRGA